MAKSEARMTKRTIFPWGKHKGDTVMSVIVEDVSYISWCLENIETFTLDTYANEAYEAFKKGKKYGND